MLIFLNEVFIIEFTLHDKYVPPQQQGSLSASCNYQLICKCTLMKFDLCNVGYTPKENFQLYTF